MNKTNQKIYCFGLFSIESVIISGLDMVIGISQKQKVENFLFYNRDTQKKLFHVLPLLGQDMKESKNDPCTH